MSNCKIINNEVVNLYQKHSFKSQVVSQALLWEQVEILDKCGNWYKIMQTDAYESYLHKSSIIDPYVFINHNLKSDDIWYRVKKRIVKIKKNTNNGFKLLSFGTIIPIIAKENNSFITIMPDESKYYIPTNSLVPYTKRVNFIDIVKYAMENLGSPYFWGGKSGFGYDCSGFIQALYSFKGMILPRDTKDQIKSSCLSKISSDYKIGDLIYFHEDNLVNHVGMFINKTQFIHSSGYIKINSIFKDDNKYDDKLSTTTLGVYRLKDV